MLMESLRWMPEMALGVPEMDAAHEAFLDELQRLAAATDEEFAVGFGPMVATVERDFRDEEDMMEEIGDPGLHEHREQHARVLAGLHHAEPYVMRGDIEAGRAVVRLLAHWFMVHLSTLDRALAVTLGACAETLEPSKPA